MDLRGNETKEKCKIFQAEQGLICDRNMSVKKHAPNYLTNKMSGILNTLKNQSSLVNVVVV